MTKDGADEPAPVVPLTVDEIRVIVEMIDKSPTTARARLSAHEMRGIADVLRGSLESNMRQLWMEAERLTKKVESLERDAGAVVRAYEEEKMLGYVPNDLAAPIALLRDQGLPDWWKKG